MDVSGTGRTARLPSVNTIERIAPKRAHEPCQWLLPSGPSSPNSAQCNERRRDAGSLRAWVSRVIGPDDAVASLAEAHVGISSLPAVEFAAIPES